jgi:myo-inositol 2-dehydrogenase/D-chiro-inositol 1-dehydrogenase
MKNPELASPLVTRRAFLRTTALAATGAAATLAVSRAAFAAGSDAIKIALIGCGGRGTGAASQALSTQGSVKLWAMADVFEDKLEASLATLSKGGYLRTLQDLAAIAKGGRVQDKPIDGFGDRIDVPKERRFVGFDAYKHAIDSGPDVVLLTTPPGFRALHFEYAVRRSKNVFLEKPVAVDAPGVRLVLAVNEEAKKKGLKVGVGLQRRYQTGTRENIRRIREGEIGDILFMRCYWEMGELWMMPRQPGQTEMEYQMRNWYYFTWLSGDHIVEQHVHNLDTCNWVKGGHPITAQGQGGRQVRTGKEYGQIFDHHFIEFTYEDGCKLFSQSRQIPGCYNSTADFAHGTKGWANLAAGIYHGPAAPRQRKAGAENVNPYQAEHDALFAAIRNNTPHNEAEYAAHGTMTAILGRMASYSGIEVQWKDALESQATLAPSGYAWDATPPVLPGADGRYPVPIPGLTKVL